MSEGSDRYKKYKKTYKKYYDANKVKIQNKHKEWIIKLKEEGIWSKANSIWNNNHRFNGLKELVLERDNWCCQDCGMSIQQHIVLFNKQLNVHHIDWDRKNNVLENLVTLCLICHGKRHGEVYRNSCKGVN